jgi:hypothetical protein
MGPLSAVALAVWMFIVGLTWLGAITAGLHVLGWLSIIVAIVILVDTFWFGSGTWYSPRRGRSAP